MLKITDNTRNKVFYAGALLLVVGGALFYWALQRFDNLPNYQRLAVLLPVTLAAAMLHVDAYRDWASVDAPIRGRAIGAIIVPVVVLIGTVLWWLIAPDARA